MFVEKFLAGEPLKNIDGLATTQSHHGFFITFFCAPCQAATTRFFMACNNLHMLNVNAIQTANCVCNLLFCGILCNTKSILAYVRKIACALGYVRRYKH